jgi:protein-tyrosine phosphatase
MIDLHCHLLPNIDDGSCSWEESLDMVRMASQDGIKGVVTTPHWIEGTNWQPETQTVRDMVAEMNRRVEDAGIDFKVYPGMEVGITADLAGLIERDRILTLAEGDYLLIEVPFHSLPLGMAEIISELRSIGKSAVLAHPERNRELQQKPIKILEYVKAGALVQVTAGSLSGEFGQSARRCAFEFAKLDALDFVSTDAHSVRYRKPIVSEGLKALEKAVGADKVDSVIDASYRIANLSRQS